MLPAATNVTPKGGPRTPHGKAIASRNATKHGILAANIGLNEDKAAYRRLRDALFHEWNPEGPTEQALVEMLVAQLWRIRRTYNCEAFVQDLDHLAETHPPDDDDENGVQIAYTKNPLETLAHYEGKIRRAMVDILRELRIAQTRRLNYRLMRVTADGQLVDPY